MRKPPGLVPKLTTSSYPAEHGSVGGRGPQGAPETIQRVVRSARQEHPAHALLVWAVGGNGLHARGTEPEESLERQQAQGRHMGAPMPALRSLGRAI
jgi:hypothetical protein